MTTSKRTRCFFSETPIKGEDQTLFLDPSETRHLEQILRLGPGSEVRVTDGLGHEALAVILSFEADSTAKLRVLTLLQKPEQISLRLFTAFAAKGVMDEVVEKGQELGVTHFYPLITEHTVVSLAGEKEGKVLDRWYKITREAAKQSRTAELMKVHSPVALKDALKFIPAGEEALVFHPDEAAQSLGDWIREKIEAGSAARPVSLFIGPEGGFSDRELEQAMETGQKLGIHMKKIYLGNRILRVSTAVVGAVSAVQWMR